MDSGNGGISPLNAARMADDAASCAGIAMQVVADYAKVA